MSFSALTFAKPSVQADSSALAALGLKLEQYVKALEPLGADAHEEECDFLVSSCRDSVTRQYVTLWLYSHYVSSDVMGAEAVAIDIADKWIFSGRVKMKNDIDLMNARIYADFNRMSLIGRKAPEMTLADDAGDSLCLYAGDRSLRYSILYFYDTGCPECLAQTVLLRTYLSSISYPLDVYAVYVGADSLSWKHYREERLSVNSASVNVVHFWDSDLASDFQRKYGVLKTPQMLLVGKDNVILGRRLDVPALALMIDRLYSSDDYGYGSEESADAFSRIFAAGEDNADGIRSAVDRIASRVSDDPPVFKETVGDMFYYLAGQRDGAYKECAGYIADKYILSRPDVWDTAADTVKVVGYARTISDLFSRAMPGTAVPSVKVRGVLARGGVPAEILGKCGLQPQDGGKVHSRNRDVSLQRLPGGTYVMFYDKDCEACRRNILAADRLMRTEPGMRVFFAELGGDDVTAALLDAFDLTSLPYIFSISEKGVTGVRYIDFERLLAEPAGNTFGGDGN